MSERWDHHFLRNALLQAHMSKDPSTKVGAVIVGPDREIRSAGFNGFPRGIADTRERLNDRDTKLGLVVHAEMNAVLNAARIGTATKGCSMYLMCDTPGQPLWGAPCRRCVVEIIQAGITEVVGLPFNQVPDRWKASTLEAIGLMQEAGVRYREVPFDA